MFFLINNLKLIFKKPIPVNNYYNVIGHQKSIEKIENIKTKYVLVDKILNDIMNCCNYNELYCWFPVGFNRYPGCPNNNIGIITFNYKRGTTLEQLQNLIEKNKYMAIGSKNNMDKLSGSVGGKCSNFIKRKIDVVLTMGNIFGCPEYITNGISNMNGFFGKDMITENNYPVYVWSLTLNDKAYITYSISMKDFNIEKCKQITNGKIINC